MLLSYFNRVFALALVTAFCASCITFSTSTVSIVDAQKARKFADAFVEEVLNDRHDAMYSKMESEFHEMTSRAEFDEAVRALDDRFGKIIAYKFDRDEPGTKMYTTRKTKPTRRIFYRATTSKGKYTFVVTVVSYGDELAVTDFVFLVESQ